MQCAVSRILVGRRDGTSNTSVRGEQGGEARGRYSIIGLKPDLIWRCRDGKAEINRSARADADKFEPAELSAA